MRKPRQVERVGSVGPQHIGWHPERGVQPITPVFPPSNRHTGNVHSKLEFPLGRKGNIQSLEIQAFLSGIIPERDKII